MTLDRVCARGLMLSFLLASCSVYAGYRECYLPQGEAIGTFPTEFFISQATGNDSDWQIENFRKVPDSNWTQAWGDKTAKSIHSPPWKYRVDPSRDFQTAWVYATTSQGREHQAKFTCVQLSAILTADLCDRATVWDTKIRWGSIESRKPFVAEAKNRGLDCGVGTDTSALRSSAPESTSNGLTAAAIDDLCNRATTQVGGKLVWEPSKLFEKDVQEAKRRNLSCGVEKVEVAKSEETSSQPKNDEIEKLLAANGALREEIESLVKANSALKEELQKANKQNGVSAADGKILRDKDLLIGSQASQIADLTKQIAENKPSLEAANQKISSQSDQINRLSAQIKEMQSNLDEADKKLQQLAQIFGGAASPGLVAPPRTASSQRQSTETQSNQFEGMKEELRQAVPTITPPVKQKRIPSLNSTKSTENLPSQRPKTEITNVDPNMSFAQQAAQELEKALKKANASGMTCDDVEKAVASIDLSKFINILEQGISERDSASMQQMLLLRSGTLATNFLRAALEKKSCKEQLKKAFIKFGIRFFDPKPAFSVELLEIGNYESAKVKEEFTKTVQETTIANQEFYARFSKWFDYENREKSLTEQVLNYTETGSLEGTEDTFWVADSKNQCSLKRYGTEKQFSSTLDFKLLNATAVRFSTKPLDTGFGSGKVIEIREGSKLLFVVSSARWLSVGTEIDIDRLQKGWGKATEACPGKASAF